MFLRSVFISAFVASAYLPVSAASATTSPDADTPALIKSLSQAFSDASARGDAATLGRLLDDNVIFINETGIVSTKNDVVGSAVPSPPGVSNALKQTDWQLRLYGSVAVTAFTDVSTVQFHGQIVMSSYRSTEVWLHEGSAWRMISSQTIALQDDPPAVTLPPGALDDYTGTYTAGPGFDVAIVRNGAELSASVNGGPAVAMKAELRDVFFIPGSPRLRRVFQRDASGSVTGFVSRREGHDITFRRIVG